LAGRYLVAGLKALGATQSRITARSDRGDEASGELVLIGMDGFMEAISVLSQRRFAGWRAGCGGVQRGELEEAGVDWWDFLMGRLFKDGRTQRICKEGSWFV
jgi:hypothetical protein